MKKICIIMLAFLLISCNNGSDDSDAVEVIELDTKPYHRVKNFKKSGGLPFLMDAEIEVVDDEYSDYILEVYDHNTEMVWVNKFRDLLSDEIPSPSDIVVENDKMIVKVGKNVMVFDLLSGEFLWEVETGDYDANFKTHNNILYVLNYGEDLLTYVNLESGKKEVHVKGSEQTKSMNRIIIEDGLLMLYEVDFAGSQVGLNAAVYDVNGEMKRYKRFDAPSDLKTYTVWDQAEASSALVEASVKNLLDMDPMTSWAESVRNYGEDEWIEIRKALPTLISEVVIYNGNHTSQKAFEENAKLKEITLSIGDARKLNYKFKEAVLNEPTVIRLITPLIADYIYITIEEGQPGTLYKDLYITDIYTK